MIKVKCDGCGTRKDVKVAFITLWNGNILDLCWKCADPIATIIDQEFHKRLRWVPDGRGK